MPKAAKSALALGGVIAVAAVAAWFLLRNGDDEDRPPIIISNGPVDVSIEYADQTHNTKGEWTRVGSSGRWRHDHPGSPSQRLQLSVLNGTCPNGRPDAGGLRATYGSGTVQKEMTITLAGTNVFVDAGSDTVVKDPNDPSHLTIGGAGDRISRIDPETPGDNRYCTFAENERPFIRVIQRRK